MYSTPKKKKVNFDRLQVSSINQLKIRKIKNRQTKSIRADLKRIVDCHLFDCAYITNRYLLILLYNEQTDTHQTCMPGRTDRFQRRNEQYIFSLLE